jgi:hypothetical protein
MLIVATISCFAYAQGASSSLSGVVIDQSGGVVPGADVMVKNDANGAEFKTITAGNGTFSIPALDAGTYTATIAMAGFKQAIIKDVKIVAASPSNIRVTLQVGGRNETVTVVASAEMLQSQTANISTTMTLRQIANLPLATRNAIDFLVMLPGVNTTAGARASTVSGLPGSTINITIDGVTTNGGPGGSGFYSFITPRLDATQEVTVSSATPGSESAGFGAVQIRFVTRSGDNNYHGSFYEYHRNPVLNSNYWFNNRDKTPTYNGSTDPCTPAQLANEWDKCKAPRDRMMLNQFGGRVGGPFLLPRKLFGPLSFDGRDKAFFFINYEEFRLPQQQTRTRTIYNPEVENGTFRYTAGGTVQRVDLLKLAANNGQVSTIDPTLQKLLADIRKSTAQGSIADTSDPSYQYFYVTNRGIDIRKYLTTRFDLNLTSKQKLEGVWNYSQYHFPVDFLNSGDPAYPGFPNIAGYRDNRFSYSLTLRSTLTSRLVNEAHFGSTAGRITYGPEVSAGQFANLGSFAYTLSGTSRPYASVTDPQPETSPIFMLDDKLSWTKGTHSLSFGASWTQNGDWAKSQAVVPTLSFGLDTTYDPARTIFDATNGPKNFLGASSSQISAAAGIYAALTGRVTAITGSAVLNEDTLQYAYNGPNVQNEQQREIGLFASDAWRVIPGLTANFGLRWQLQLPFTPLNDVLSFATVADIWGPSGVGNLFKPGSTGGKATQLTQFRKGDPAYDIDYKAFAPSFGFAWSPSAKGGWLGRIVGGNGQTVLRGGYSMAYNRYTMSTFTGVFGSNPGVTIDASRNSTLGNLVGTNEAWPVLFREKNRLGPPAFPTTPAYPLTPAITSSVRAFAPSMRTPYSMSWTFGLQREVTRDMALEVRYVATRNLQTFTGMNLNEINIVENGFLTEFQQAMANLQSNIAAGRGNTFKYAGPGTGTLPLPITLAYFAGIPASQASDASKYTSSQFTNSTFVNTLAKYNPNPSTFASSLYSDATRRSNALAAGLPANEFLVNPYVATAYVYQNNGSNRYDSMVVELRRRMARGLLVQANYTFSKGFDSSRLSFRAPLLNVLGGNLPHAFKINWVYEMPIGHGKMLFASSHGVLDRIIGGWEFQGTSRIQSGNLLNFGNVRPVGMTLRDLQNAVGMRFDDANKNIYYEPADIIANTIAAYNTSATTATGYSTAYGVPSGRYLAPANSGGCIQVVAGDCAPNTLLVRGPGFTRFDLSLVKKMRFSESRNLELRGEFLNAFNNINFYGVANPSSSQTWGQVTTAYRDPNQQVDPGGRLIQIVLRFNY